MNIFHEAIKNKYRFKTSVGNLATEDLYDLPLTAGGVLDNLAKKLAHDLSSNSTSFIENTTYLGGKKEKAKLEIVTAIIKERLDDKEAKINKAKTSDLVNKIQEIINKKEDTELEGKTAEELNKLIDELRKDSLS